MNANFITPFFLNHELVKKFFVWERDQSALLIICFLYTYLSIRKTWTCLQELSTSFEQINLILCSLIQLKKTNFVFWKIRIVEFWVLSQKQSRHISINVELKKLLYISKTSKHEFNNKQKSLHKYYACVQFLLIFENIVRRNLCFIKRIIRNMTLNELILAYINFADIANRKIRHFLLHFQTKDD